MSSTTIKFQWFRIFLKHLKRPLTMCFKVRPKFPKFLWFAIIEPFHKWSNVWQKLRNTATYRYLLSLYIALTTQAQFHKRPFWILGVHPICWVWWCDHRLTDVAYLIYSWLNEHVGVATGCKQILGWSPVIGRCKHLSKWTSIVICHT